MGVVAFQPVASRDAPRAGTLGMTFVEGLPAHSLAMPSPGAARTSVP